MKIELYPKPQLEELWQKDCHEYETGEQTRRICLRCGGGMDHRMLHNSLSRYAAIYICNDCGADEAGRDIIKDPLPLLQWDTAVKGRIPKAADAAYLTAECDFLHIFQKTKPVPFSSQQIPESQVVYSRSDYDGYRWHTTWHDCQEEKPAQELVKEIDAFHNALFQMPEMKSLDTMRLLCIDAQTTGDRTEYNLYSETEHFYIWLRLITRNKDYNLYCLFALKNNL